SRPPRCGGSPPPGRPSSAAAAGPVPTSGNWSSGPPPGSTRRAAAGTRPRRSATVATAPWPGTRRPAAPTDRAENRSRGQAARPYTWCSPPSTGRDAIRPSVTGAAGFGGLQRQRPVPAGVVVVALERAEDRARVRFVEHDVEPHSLDTSRNSSKSRATGPVAPTSQGRGYRGVAYVGRCAEQSGQSRITQRARPGWLQ